MRSTRWILALSLVMTAPLRAQTGEVVQATPPAEAVAALNRHLASLSRNPQDVNALLGAGKAALDLGDVQAAHGFYTRANMVNGRSGQAKLGLAVVQIALKQPADAASNFDAAAALGVGADGYLAERGLAYDLTGQQAKAQQDYRAALQTNPNDSAARIRYAVSLAISGNLTEANQQLEPILAQSDREAWRMRAFIFAMNGRIAEARSVTQSTMPKGLADALDPYLQRLPLLTASQKAAAVHYGEYPAQVLRLAAPEPVRARDTQVAANVEREPAPRRETRTRMSASERRAAERAEREAAARARTAAARAPAPARQPTPAPTSTLASAQPAQTTLPASQPTRTPTPAPAATLPAPVRQTTPTPAPAPTTVAAALPPPPPPPPTAPVAEPRRSLADTIVDLTVPESERRPSGAMADMTAVARIQEQRRAAAAAAAAKAKADAEAKAKADAARKAEAERKAKLAANPSRNWVQIAAGRDPDALAFDLRRMRRTYSQALSGHDGWTATWGQTRRLLIGPFRRPEDARAVVAELKKAGGDAFYWQSDVGEEVTKIGSQ